jgi:hypothetical protein
MRCKTREPTARIQIRLAKHPRLRGAYRRGGVCRAESQQDQKDDEFMHEGANKITG